MIYSISVRYLLLNFKTILDGFPIFIYIFFIHTLNTESNAVSCMNSDVKASERGEIQPIQVRNF